MRIRVEGTRAEADAVIEVVRQVLDVQEVSGFYPNRGTSALGRVYLTVAAPTAPVVRARAERIIRRKSVNPAPGKEITS